MPGATRAGHTRSLHPRNFQLDIQWKTPLGIGKVHREPTSVQALAFTRSANIVHVPAREGQQRSVRVLAVADCYGRAGGTDLDAGSAVVAATW